ncbi:MAG: transporter substrate-binding domain-containing protein [Desulfobacterales bacterium]|nr:transporter substrate-binding domain-containing protein [Desulfobacterales bacterium]
MKKLIITLIVTALLVPVVGSADEKIVLAVLDDFPPFQWKEKGQVVGIDADIIREVCRRLGIALEYKAVPWKRALESAKNGRMTGILTALYKEERTKFLYYTKETVHIQKNIVMIRKGSNIKINGFDDLKNRKVGVVRGFSYGSEFDSFKGLEKEVCNNQKDLVNILARERIDVAMGSEMPLMYNAKQLGFQNAIEIGYVITKYPTYTVFSKARENGKLLAQKFDTALREIKQEGMDQKIIDNYLK